MRGAHADGHRLDQPAGIIPADAGSTNKVAFFLVYP